MSMERFLPPVVTTSPAKSAHRAARASATASTPSASAQTALLFYRGEPQPDPALKAGFEQHLEETRGQIARLEQIFEKLSEKPKAVTCPAIDGIIKEANETAGEVADKEVLEVATKATAHLYVVNPVHRFEARAAGFLATHSPLVDRINRLRALRGARPIPAPDAP